MTYTAFQRPTIDIIATKLADGARSILVGIHLHKCETTVRLEAGLLNISEALKKRNEVTLGGVWGQVADVASSLPLRSLLNNHFIALKAMGREVVVPIRGCRSHSHR